MRRRSKIEVSRTGRRVLPARNPGEDDVQVLCGCGWGRLRCPRNEVPSECPLCGLPLDREIEVDEIDEVVGNPRLVDSRRVELPRRMKPAGACGMRRRNNPRVVPPRLDPPVDLIVEGDVLRIRLDPLVDREDIEALLERPAPQAFADLIEWYLGNGWELLRPSEIGAITESPILSNEVERDEDGNLVSVGTVYWYPQYESKSEIEELLKHGEIVFTANRSEREEPRRNVGMRRNSACRGCGAPGWGVGAEGLCPACWSPSKHSGPVCSRCGATGHGSLETFAFTHKCKMPPAAKRRRPNGQLSPLGRVSSEHACPSDGVDQRGRCVGTCRDCDEHLLLTGRYTPYCPSCQTCEACGCPDVDGFSHYEGCQLEPVVVESISVARNGRRSNRKARPTVWVERNPLGRRNEPRGIKSVHKNRFVVVEVDIGIDDSIDDVLSDPNVTEEEIDAALAPFNPARTFDVRRDVEEILSRGGITPRARSEEVGGAMRFAYMIPDTHNPTLVANALRNYFKGQRDVKISLQ